MRHHILLIAASALATAGAFAQESATRDGSTEQKAIVVPASVSDAKAHDWQIAYLNKHFPNRALNGSEHAFIGHDEQRRWYDYYSFRVAGKKKEVYFDVSKQTLEWAKAHGLTK